MVEIYIAIIDWQYEGVRILGHETTVEAAQALCIEDHGDGYHKDIPIEWDRQNNGSYHSQDFPMQYHYQVYKVKVD